MKKPHSLLLLTPLILALAASPATAQRKPRMADRVAALEQQANAPSPTLELLQQMEDMRAEIRNLQAQIEELQHRNEETARNGRTQYLDVDTRLQRLEKAITEPQIVIDPDTGQATAVAPGTVTPATPEERSAYEAALNALKAGQYVESAGLFMDFLERYPSGAYAPNAVYWLGESYYVTENYALALEEFKSLTEKWPQHDKAPGALLKLGLSQLGLKNTAQARQTLEAVSQRYPGSDAAKTASERLRALGQGR